MRPNTGDILDFGTIDDIAKTGLQSGAPSHIQYNTRVMIRARCGKQSGLDSDGSSGSLLQLKVSSL